MIEAGQTPNDEHGRDSVLPKAPVAQQAEHISAQSNVRNNPTETLPKIHFDDKPRPQTAMDRILVPPAVSLLLRNEPSRCTKTGWRKLMGDVMRANSTGIESADPDTLFRLLIAWAAERNTASGKQPDDLGVNRDWLRNELDVAVRKESAAMEAARLRLAVEPVELKDIRCIQVLGTNGRHIVLFNPQTRRTEEYAVRDIRAGELRTLCGREIENFAGETRRKIVGDDGERRTLTWDELEILIEHEAAKRQIGRLEHVGSGIFPHGDGLLMIGADRWCHISSDGKVSDVTTPIFDGKYIKPKSPGPSTESLLNPVSAAEVRVALKSALDDLRKWGWSHPQESLLWLAQLVSMPMQAVFRWRGQTALQGSSRSGKSLLLEWSKNFLGTALLQEKVTAAGLRQAIAHDSVPVLLDEAEPDGRLNVLLEMLRGAGAGATISTGTADQRGREFTVRLSAIFASTVSGAAEDPVNSNRFTVFNLVRAPSSFIGGAGAHAGRTLIAAAVQRYSTIKALEDALFIADTSRFAGNLRGPLACLGALLGMNKEQAVRMQSTFLRRLQADASQESGESAEELLLESILTHRLERENCTVAQAIAAGRWQLIEPLGITNAGQRKIFIASFMVATWLGVGRKQITTKLSRLPNAKLDRMDVGGRRSKGVAVSI